MDGKRNTHRYLIVLSLAVWALAASASAQTRIADISRIKGQEDNELVGLGLVIGLRGTGDGGDTLPAIRSLANAMQLMGQPLPGGLKELSKAKNLALVMVSARIPGTGSREGSRVDCMVASIGKAKSLAGGRLFATALLDARPGGDVVYGMAQGAVQTQRGDARTGRVHLGCRLMRDFFTPYVKDGRITVVLDKDVADFRLAHEIEYRINRQFGEFDTPHGKREPAKAMDQANIIVYLPPEYQAHPTDFVAQVKDIRLDYVPQVARVYIDRESGLVVIGGEVEIGSVAIRHKDNIAIQAGGPGGDGFVGLDTTGEGTSKLKSMVDALNAIKVPASDVIEIIRGLQRNGKLLGKVVIE